ncbi:pyruvate, phosphate dikinase [Sulfuritalea hydrogenivorans]|uniref:Pyruvate, phosphate dikinase n=1 Tax=Sulfuritalea hydrogenivorans sk43H TaxID=1223802 RepID=W0SEI5_9PROT|nr:pyruvate, phosphate dikinase [Sulfuritalea hydrogenivorans]MDK9714655.1 pyruvate, phosphate dikinase [Sulfuritalea sp.]BAO29649.1 pyruvate, phosphate dikinase [Sulfuritalea hydrogenivorans sk43H]
MKRQWVFAFEEGDGKNKMLLGGKGANLCEMTQIGLNVPPGFTLTTEACQAYLEHDELPKGAWEEVLKSMKDLEKKTGKQFGGTDNPLLISVRSGSSMSMPGMMDTILNLGLNKATLQGIIKLTNNPRFGYDAWRRFIQLFGKIALGVEDKHFDDAMAAMKKKVGVADDVDLKAEHLSELADQFAQIIEANTGKPFPEDPYKQLEIAIGAVFRSWNGKRAIDYRRQFKITREMANGTAVNICTMVFGNMGNDSGTGVGFTRNPGTGENMIYGEYLVNAQGEDVVAGIRTPKAIAEMEHDMPEIYRQLLELHNRLETHYKEVQDFEFTIERGTLYCLQTRNGKMNAAAMVRTSVEMFKEGLITKEKALMRIDPAMLEQLLVPQLSPDFRGKPLATGLPASPGAASGKIVFDADTAESRGMAGEKIILVREETKPEDIHGFFQAQGILTSRGGKTSHAAVVARGMGKPCVSGCEAIHINDIKRSATIGDTTLHEGDVVTIDGGNGNVYAGEVPTVQAEFSHDMETLLKWADQVSRLKVMANADTPEDALRARGFGAMGIGLCRTERMFNATDRLPIVQEMILAESIEERQAAIDRLLPIQRADFKGIFKAMKGLPVTVRLMDPPLHEFLPTAAQLELEIAHLHHLRDSLKALEELPETLKLLNPKLYMQYADGLTKLGRSMTDFKEGHLEEDVIHKKEKTLKKVRALSEVNPMLGHRGVRLGITYPEIYSMQIQAVLEAAALCAREGIEVHPEIMVPQVATVEELVRIHSYVKRIHKVVELTHGIKVDVKFGSMLEVVRACLRAGRMAQDAEFFSFGTNDLTQATFSFSREDAENKFLPGYVEAGILVDNPFEVLDQKGVGELMKLAVSEGRKTNPDLKVGICGEHGGHPGSIAFCHSIGLTYVSCSGPRVPIARLAAAQAQLMETGGAVTKNA